MYDSDDVRTGIPEEIRPSELLWVSTIDSMPIWERFDADPDVGELLGSIMRPLQSSMMGVDLKTMREVDHDDALDLCYRERNRAELLLSRLDRRFFNDAVIMQARPSYAPLRMLGWWNRCLSDEIDWLIGDGGSLADPYGNARSWFPPVKAPPRFWRWEISSWDGIREVCRQTAIMHGLPDHMVDVMTEMMMATIDIDDDDDDKMDALIEMMKSRPFVGEVLGIDVETTGLNPLRSWLVNAGWLMTDLNDPSGKTWGEASRSYGVPTVRAALGNPTEYISGISTDDLNGLKRIDDDVMAQQDILDVVTSHPYVAHSSRTEDSFFVQNVAGYAEAKRDGLIRIIDSRSVSQRLDDYPGKISNKLEDYAKRWGVLPEDGKERHLGLDDSTIMLKALGRNLRSLHGGPDSRTFRDRLVEHEQERL